MAERKTVSVRFEAAELALIDERRGETSRQDYLHARCLADPAAPAAPDPADWYGEVGRRVRQDIAALVCSHPMGEALAAIAENLADALDNRPGQLRAAIAQQLVAVLSELAGHDASGEDDDDDFRFGAPSLGDGEDAE